MFPHTATAMLKMIFRSYQISVCSLPSTLLLLDQACADAVNRQPVISGSVLAEKEHCHHDHFTDTHPDTNWETCLEHAVKLGMGNREYDLIEVE